MHEAHPKKPEKGISMVTRERFFSLTIGQDQTPTHSLTCSSIHWHLPFCGYIVCWCVLFLLPHPSRVQLLRAMLQWMSTVPASTTSFPHTHTPSLASYLLHISGFLYLYKLSMGFKEISCFHYHAFDLKTCFGSVCKIWQNLTSKSVSEGRVIISFLSVPLFCLSVFFFGQSFPLVLQRFCTKKTCPYLSHQGLTLFCESVPGLLCGDIHDKKIWFCPYSIITDQW